MIVGGGAAEDLIKALEASTNTDIRIAGIFDDRGNERVSPVVAGYPKLGNIDELVKFARNSRLDLLIVSLPVTAEKRLLQLLKKLWVLPVDIRLSAHSNQLRFRPRTYSYIGNVPFIDVTDRPIADWDHVKKWWFDKIAASVALILLSPLMAAIAVLIKLDSKGPVLFRQKRQGFNNELIEVYKFRSMYVGHADIDASRLVTKDDPRVTRIGRFLRKTSLDELPQFFNVLKGDPRWWDRGRTRSRPRPRPSSITTWWTAISPATASSRASPAGRRSPAGGARPTPPTRSSDGSSTTSITSRIGRSLSTSISA